MTQNNPAWRYLQSLESTSSRTSMQSILNIACNFFENGKTIDTYDWSQLNSDLLLELRDILKKNKKSPATINTYLSALKSVSKQAWRLKLINIENYEYIKEIRRVKGSRVTKSRSLSLNELNTLLDYCMAKDGAIAMRDACLIALGYGAGLRRHEAVGLQISDYDKNKRNIRVLGKGNKERINPLNPRIIDILECWLDERGRHPGALFLRVRKGNNITGDALSTQSVYDIVVKRYKEAGLERLSPHDLRHTFATKLLESGVDIFVVKDLMGHSNVETTKIYDNRDEKAKIIAVNELPL